MGALVDLSDCINVATGGGAAGAAGGELICPFKDDSADGVSAVTVAGRWSSLWQYHGQRPTHGSAPGGTARNPTRATSGAIGQANPTGGRQKWLTGIVNAFSTAIGSLNLYDRLADISGLVGNSASAQSITGLSVSRYTGTESAGNEIWLEIFTLIGTTATTVTASYTNQDGTSGRTTQATAIGGTGLREVQRFIRLPLQAGDTGVRSVESITLAATTGTAGDIGVVIARPLASIACYQVGVGVARDFLTSYPGPIEIKTDAALAFSWLATTTTAPAFQAFMQFLEK